jgi:hypothetical protein
MLNLGKTKRAVAMAAAGLALAGGLTVTAAGSASATIGCTGGDGCNHQTTIYMNGSTYAASKEFWGPFTVLKMQTDGNLVLYCQSNGNLGSAIWASGTDLNNSSPYVEFEGGSGGGSMVIYQNVLHTSPAGGSWISTDAVWSSLTKPPTHSTRGTEAIVQADDNFVIYDAYGNALWSSGTYHDCGNDGYWG